MAATIHRSDLRRVIVGVATLQHVDMELAKRAADGDRGAFHAIVDRYGTDLYRVARVYTRSQADAEDVVQETFLAAYRAMASYDGRSSLKTWLSKITMKRAISSWRKNRRHWDTAELSPIEEPTTAARAPRSSAVAEVDQRLDLAVVLETIAPEHREIFVMREIRGLSYAEIANELNIPAGTVDSRLYRARAELRKKMKGYGSDEATKRRSDEGKKFNCGSDEVKKCES